MDGKCFTLREDCLKDAASVAVRLRDDPKISGSCIVGTSLLASTSFGHFGIKALQFLEAERQEVEREKHLAEERKWRETKELERERGVVKCILLVLSPILCFLLYPSFNMAFSTPETGNSAGWQAGGGGMVFCLVCSYGWVVWILVASIWQDKQQKLLLAISYLTRLAGVVAYGSNIAHCLLAGYWWTILFCAGFVSCGLVLPYILFRCYAPEMLSLKEAEQMVKRSAADATIVFHGSVLEGDVPCICSWPGIYVSAWDALVHASKDGELSAAVVFLPEGSQDYGKHDSIPEEEQLNGDCWCEALYGERKPWGCHWWTKWISNIEKAHQEGAEMLVYYFHKKKGRGKVKSFETAGDEHLRRDAIRAKLGNEDKESGEFFVSKSFEAAVSQGIKSLSKEKGADSSSQYSREVKRLFLQWLPEEERDFLEASEGLGYSQKAEVAWLERNGYSYKEVEVHVSDWIRDSDVGLDIESPEATGSVLPLNSEQKGST